MSSIVLLSKTKLSAFNCNLTLLKSSNISEIGIPEPIKITVFSNYK